VSDWLSGDVVRFKINVGVEEKFMCKNVTKQMQQRLPQQQQGWASYAMT